MFTEAWHENSELLSHLLPSFLNVRLTMILELIVHLLSKKAAPIYIKKTSIHISNSDATQILPT